MRFTPVGKICSFCGETGRPDTKFAGGLGALMCADCLGRYAQIFASRSNLEAVSRPPWDDHSEAAMLAKLPLIADTSAQVDEFLQHWVNKLRSRRVPWSEIGKALGISRQAAWQRFSRDVPSSASASESETG